MVVKGRREDKLTKKLTDMLERSDLDAQWESEHRGGKRIDIEVSTKHLRIAVECEKHGSGKHAEAIRDAVSRLIPIPLVDVAVAVVYPRGCDTVDDLTDGAILEYCVVQPSDAATYGDAHARHAEASEWLSCPANQLADVLRHLHSDIGDPSHLANRLKVRLDEAVARLDDGEKRSLASAIELKNGIYLDSAARRALLVVASAALFHARLGGYLEAMKPDNHTDEWPPQTLGECRISDDGVREALTRSWRMILEVDYQPIFRTAVSILAKGSGQQFADAISSMVEWAHATAEHTEGMRHDLLGRIFHAVLDTAKQDGSLYTSTPAAVLLAGLAIRNRADIPANLSKMKIMDPACGTGTLLMAAAERMRDILGGDYDPRVMVERVLCGVDINVTAAHMAATTIGMLSPDTTFDRMDIRTTTLGMVDGVARAGSLEMYAEDGLLPYMDWYGGPDSQVDTGEAARHTWRSVADLVIMNPPFPRNNKRHDQLGGVVEKRVKSREGEIFKRAPKGMRYSSGPMFMLLAEYLLRSDSGCLAVVVPMVMSNNPSNHTLRVFLAGKFHVDTIVATHDPEQFNFSDSTAIAEMLVILRRQKTLDQPKDTRIINLAVNPGTVAGAGALVNMINSGKTDNCQVVEWPRSRIEQGDWSGVQFYSPYLTDRFVEIMDGTLFKTNRLGDVAEFVNFQDVYGAFTASDTPDRHARRALVYNSVDTQRSLNATLDKYLIEKTGYERRAEELWNDGCLLHLQLSLQPNITHVTATKTDQPSIGFTWRPTRPKAGIADDVDAWSKAMTVYLNSTIGVVALLGVKNPRKPLWPRYPVKNLRMASIPDIPKTQMEKMARLYDEYRHDVLGLLRRYSEVRIKIDEIVGRILNVDPRVVGAMRIELSREPMVTGRRYREQPKLTDYE